MRTLYDVDFFAWTQDTADKIRDCKFHDIDLQVLAEEIEDLGRSDRNNVYSALVQLLSHLLKWEHQPDYRKRAGEASWNLSIVKQRQRIHRQFRQSPSLKRYAQEDLDEAYCDAVLLAEAETGIKGQFPSHCPYSLDQILDLAFYPTK